jgi:nitrate/nitrite transport system substrate-binding protein
MWLYYWLAAYGINPMKDAKVITVPPPQMVANMRVGNMDGYCVGEPWGAPRHHRRHRFSPPPPPRTSGRTIPRKCWAARRLRQEVPQHRPRHHDAAMLEAGRWIDSG